MRGSSSKMTRGRGRRIQKDGATREVYGKGVIWVG